MNAAQHRRARLAWAIAAAVWLLVSLGGLRWPWINTYIAPARGYVWCLVGAAYHHGWLHAHKPDEPKDAP